jgi:hypothetical protein
MILSFFLALMLLRPFLLHMGRICYDTPFSCRNRGLFFGENPPSPQGSNNAVGGGVMPSPAHRTRSRPDAILVARRVASNGFWHAGKTLLWHVWKIADMAKGDLTSPCHRPSPPLRDHGVIFSASITLVIAAIVSSAVATDLTSVSCRRASKMRSRFTPM